MSTPEESLVMMALQSLGFEMKPSNSKIVGGPADLVASNAALDRLKGKTVTVDGDGSVTVS